MGKGRVKMTISGLESLDDTGGFHVANTTRGKVTAPDVSQWEVSGRANLDIGEDGIPIGDPAEFQGLRIPNIRYGW